MGNYLADMATKMTSARQLTRCAAEKYDSGERCDMEAARTKLFASEVAMEIALNAHRRLRRALLPLMIVGEGNNEVQRNVIAAQLVSRGRL